MTERPRLFDGRNRPITIALMGTMAIASYNNLSVTAALPEIGDDLGDVAWLPWTITAELLTAAIATLVAGPIIDGWGVRRTFRSAAVGFMATSLLAAAAPSLPLLVAARALQGVSIGFVVSVAIAGIGVAFPAELRPRAFAANSAVWGVMGVGGPAIAAVIVATVGWRGIFLVNLPVAAVAASIGWNALPGPQAGAAIGALDRRGVVLVALVTSAALLTAGGDPVVMLAGATVVAVTGWRYVRHARSTPDAVVRLPDLTGLRVRRLHVASGVALACTLGTDSYLPVYIRGARGGSTALAAFSVAFLTIGWSVAAYVSSRLQDRHPAERVTLWGSLVILPGLAAATVLVAVDAPVPLILAAAFAMGWGTGTITTSTLAALQRRVETTEMGRVNSAHMFIRAIAITYGVAIAGAVIFAVVESRIGDVEPVRDLLGGEDLAVDPTTRDALADGFAWALAVATVAVSLTVWTAVRMVRRPHTSPAMA